MVLNVSNSPDYIHVWSFEKYDHESVRSWLQNGNWKVSIYASLIYLLVISLGQRTMQNRKPFNVKKYFVQWNIFLTILNSFVFLRMLPELIYQISDAGFYSTICTFENYHNIATNFWGVLFCFSKLLDFGDTLFLVLAKKPIILLHWYHHVTVAVYCVYVADSQDPATRWFAVVNSFIHVIMYGYYALRAMRYNVPMYFAKTITILQISQMIFGIFINLWSHNFMANGGNCGRPSSTIFLSLAMYASYFVLFVQFFCKKYVGLATGSKKLN